MDECYMKASDNNRLPATARQIFYVARPLIEEQTDKPLSYAYFSQTLLPNYINEHRPSDWDVVYDDRGHFTEPHTNRVIGLGTLNVRAYLSRVVSLKLEEADFAPASVETYGPDGCFGAVLYVEKEGFMPLFERVKLAERYDIAIMSSKGMSVTAARQLVEGICAEYGIPLLVLHDFDRPASSSRTRWRTTPGATAIRARPTSSTSGCTTATSTACRRNRNNSNISDERLEQAGLDQAAIDFLRNQRVELNAMTSRQLVDFVERKLKQHGIRKVIPDAETLAKTYRDVCRKRSIVGGVRRDEGKARGRKRRRRNRSKCPTISRPDQDQLKENPDITWHRAVRLIVDPDAPEETKER